MLVACKKVITRKWLQPETPEINDWLRTVNEIYTMERLTMNLRLQSGKFVKIWRKWINYIRPLRPDLVSRLRYFKGSR